MTVAFGNLNQATENVLDSRHPIAMKSYLLATIIFTVACLVEVRAVDDAISVSIVVPKGSEGERRITWRNSGTLWDREAHFHAIVSNRSDKPQKIWMEECSRGYRALSFEFTDETGKTWTAQKKGRPFTMNGPGSWVLEPGESLVYEVFFEDSRIWKDFPMPDEGSKMALTMRAVFEITSTEESGNFGIWTGRVVSEAQRIIFFRAKRNGK